MKIEMNEVKKLEKLSAFSNGEEKLQELLKDFVDITNFIDQVQKADVSNIQVKSKTLDVSELREDIIKESMSQDEILANAPEKGNGAFIVPKVVE